MLSPRLVESEVLTLQLQGLSNYPYSKPINHIYNT